MLAAHNAVRAKVGVSPLVWSAELAALARSWSKKLAAGGSLRHRPDTAYGENLFAAEGERVAPAFVVKSWASEAQSFDAATNRCRAGADCLHYTQIVWRNTKRVGCAAGRKGDREVWVCYYDPAGNWEGERPY